jgi:hypothetical protein
MVKMYVTSELEETTMNLQKFTKVVIGRQLKGIIFQETKEKFTSYWNFMDRFVNDKN